MLEHKEPEKHVMSVTRDNWEIEDVHNWLGRSFHFLEADLPYNIHIEFLLEAVDALIAYARALHDGEGETDAEWALPTWANNLIFADGPRC